MTKLNRENLLNVISNSPTIRKELSFEEHLNLYHGISKMPEPQLKRLCATLKEAELPPPVKSNPKIELILKIGLTAATIKYPIPGLALVINYMVDSARYKCIQRVEASNAPDKNLAYAHCRYRAVSESLRIVTREFHKCKKLPNPKHHKNCEKKLYKLMSAQRHKLVKAEAKLREAVLKARMKARKMAAQD